MRKWARRGLIVVVLLWTLVVALLAVGVLLPGTPVLGEFGSDLVGTYVFYAVLAAVLGLLGSVLLWWTGARRTGGAALGLGAFGVAGTVVVLVAQLSFASDQGVSVSWWQGLTEPGQPDVHADKTVRYAEVGGVGLDLSVWLPPRPATGPRPAVVLVHGGGFVTGKRDEQAGVDRWLADRGYPVFDVDYRLAPPPRWQDASQDVACALSWVAGHAAEYAVDPARLAISGGSAGGSLSLNVAYGLAEHSLASSCGGNPPVPAVAAGFYPAADVTGVYDDRGPDDFAIRAGNEYVGGSPEQFPGRYAEASALTKVRPGLMPTLLVTGASDHLVRENRVTAVADRLQAARVPHRMVVMPYGEHAFDRSYGGVGGQVGRHVLGQFLDQYLPTQ
ncbi:alpha/beta hydrolase [Amycolatopsis anabasis]|uniref:alpha/beta hydrolase n=1 Tax=Amycolatopsis anabasis TaxID=1840409 RepID=UPI00131E17B9|nr:alpha/beta hydrolase [Amycolatopsis anabasis]